MTFDIFMGQTNDMSCATSKELRDKISWDEAHKEDNSERYLEMLRECIIKPDHISAARFDKLLQVNATILNLFINNRVKIYFILDDLEKSISEKIKASSNDFKPISPKSYRVSKSRFLGLPLTRYFPVITEKSLQAEYNSDFLTAPILEQLSKHSINTDKRFIFEKYKQFMGINKQNSQTKLGTKATSPASFFEAEHGIVSFFGLVPFKEAKPLIEHGFIFSEPLHYPETDSRLHGSSSHSIQQYILSKLFEQNELGDLTVDGEDPLTMLDILQSDVFQINRQGVVNRIGDTRNDVDCLFDLKWETRIQKYGLLGTEPGRYDFSAADCLNTALMLESVRFQNLSTLLYVQYARESQEYLNQVAQSSGIYFLISVYCNNSYFEKYYNSYLQKYDKSYLVKAVNKISELSDSEKIEAMNTLSYYDSKLVNNMKTNHPEYVKIAEIHAMNFVALPKRNPRKTVDDFQINYGHVKPKASAAFFTQNSNPESSDLSDNPSPKC